MQKVSGQFQVRMVMNGTNGASHNINDSWNGLEIAYFAANQTGEMSLWINGTLVETLAGQNNQANAIDTVRLDAMGVDTGTSGTIYFDDYDSHRHSEIGLLADPVTEDPTSTPLAGCGFVVFAPCS